MLELAFKERKDCFLFSYEYRYPNANEMEDINVFGKQSCSKL